MFRCLLIAGDADVAALEHSVAMFRLLGGGAMGDMGKPLAASQLAVMSATSHTAVISQPDLLMALSSRRSSRARRRRASSNSNRTRHITMAGRAAISPSATHEGDHHGVERAIDMNEPAAGSIVG